MCVCVCCIILAVRNICSMYDIHLLVFRREAQCFLCEVRTESSLYSIRLLVFRMEKPRVLCEVRIEHIYIVLYWILHSIPDQSTWDLWWTEWQWDRFFSKYLIFPLLVPFYQCSILILIFILALPEGQTDEAWEPAKRNDLSEIG